MGKVTPKGRGRWQLDYHDGRGRRYRPRFRGTRKAADNELKRREGDIAHGRPSPDHVEKVKFEDLAEGLQRDYTINNKRSLGKAKKSIARLGQFFGGWRAVNITTADVQVYIEKRQRDGFRNGSINRELAALKRMFRLAVQARLLYQAPHIPLLQEAPPRAGFFEPEQFEAVLRHLPCYVRPIAMFAYETGWRLREILFLQWRQVNLEEGWVRLDPGTTKNREGRTAYLSVGLLDVLRAQADATRALQGQGARIIPWVFHQKGKPIGSFYKAWRTACRKAGVPGMIFHDLRRTAVRNMVRAGIPERVAMTISGHKTRSVFERYNIVSEGDLREAAMRLGGQQPLIGAVIR